MTNFLAIVVAAVVGVFIGMLWYGPFFGKPWMKMVGLANKKPSKAKMIESTIAGLINAIITAMILSIFIGLTGSNSWLAGLIIAVLVWAGFTATTQFGGVIWENKPIKLFMIQSFYSLITYVVMGIIVAVWV